MFKSPSSRRRTQNSGITLNLVPILDAMVVLIAFLLFTMAFLQIVSIETPFPTANAAPDEVIKEKPLQLSLTVQPENVTIWSPFIEGIERTIPNPSTGKTSTTFPVGKSLPVKAPALSAQSRTNLAPVPGTPSIT